MKIPTSLSSRVARQQLIARKNSPAILFGAGVVGIVGSTVLACRATLKLEDALVRAKSDLDATKTIREERPDEYSDDDRKKDVSVIYIRSAVEVAKLYAPAVALGAASIGALTTSHVILTNRNVALTAAYAAVQQGFDDYRARVVDKYGEDEDRNLRYSTEDVSVAGEDGRKKKVKRVAPDAPSVYARFFDEYTKEWKNDPEYNRAFLLGQQRWLNDLLQIRGYVFLNEVYDRLGMEWSKAGQVVGWVISAQGDNYIDFGIFAEDGSGIDFVNGREGSILLDFNVDGVIWDKIDEMTGIGA